MGGVEAGVRELLGGSRCVLSSPSVGSVAVVVEARQSEAWTDSVAPGLLVVVDRDAGQLQRLDVPVDRPLTDFQFLGYPLGVPRFSAAQDELENAEDPADAFALAGSTFRICSFLFGHGVIVSPLASAALEPCRVLLSRIAMTPLGQSADTNFRVGFGPVGVGAVGVAGSENGVVRSVAVL